MDVTVCIATFGSDDWVRLAVERALPSIPDGIEVVQYHTPAGGLAAARNGALEQVHTEWVVYLDADDELEPGYIDAMAAGSADVRGPIARYVREDHPSLHRLWQPRVHGHDHNCAAECLKDGNWLLIGSAVRAELLARAGGWREFPWSEDWSTWIRCWKAGGTFELIPEAVYRAHVRPDSRNRGASRAEKLAAHQAIHRAEFPELYPGGAHGMEAASCGCLVPHGFRAAEHTAGCPHRQEAAA